MFKQIIKILFYQLLPSVFLIKRLPLSCGNCVLLTFDDGPDPQHTIAVLDLLARYNANAIFFIPGKRIHRAPYLLSSIVRQGHIVANHSYSHIRQSKNSFKEVHDDLNKCNKLIKNYTGKSPIFYRPPFGHINLFSLFSAWKLNLKIILWSIDVNDWRCSDIDNAKEAAAKILRKVSSRDIILLHDDNRFIVQILSIILPELKMRGFNLHIPWKKLSNRINHMQ